MGADEPVPEHPDHLIGQTLAARYRIESRIGEGAMGVVYKARHVKVGRTFAVKVLHARLLQDKKVLLRFEREAELAGRLRHPNVIGVVDVGDLPDGTRYMVMDFAHGPDLAQLLDEAPMPPQRVINLTRQMLEGLYHAHEAGLIHRDFKPENVIVERDTHGTEVPRIVDFGIAILREGGDSNEAPGRLTTNGLVLGTPHYMAPEQAVADPIDHRIDLFATGIMIYEMLCGKLPFDGSGAEIARANLLIDPPPIAERVPYLEVDPLLEALSPRLMAKKRDQRPVNAKAARELLDLIVKDRIAAAAALGMPSGAAQQRGRETQPVSPPPPRHTGPETFPPPIRATPPQAPPMAAPVAVPAPPAAVPVSIERSIATEPVGASRTRRWPLIAGAAGVLAIAGTLIAVKLTGGNGTPAAAPTAPAPPPQVVVAPAPAPTPTPTPAPAPTPPPTPTPAPAAANPPPTRPTAVPHHKIVKTPVAAPPTATVARPAVVETAQPPPAPPPAPASGPLTASAFANQYAAIGQQIASYEQKNGKPAAEPLWAQYSLVSYSVGMKSQAERDKAAGIFAKLRAALR